MSCIAFDLDHFKNINDTHGHAVGDNVLTNVVAACLKRLRKSDILGRIGGEEFAIILPHTTAKGAMKAAEQIRLGVADLRAGEGTGSSPISASLGVATFERTISDLDELMRRADTALYAAKTNGRNRFAMWDSPQQQDRPMRRVFKAGQIAFNAGRSVIDCTVRALSEAGASLEVVSTAGIPDTFKLNIIADNIARRCTVVTKLDRRIEAAFA